MPSKKRSRRKPVPPILRTPIGYSALDTEVATAYKVKQRLQAVYEYYGVNPDDPHRLIELMATERFPGGFTKRWKGDPKTKKPV